MIILYILCKHNKLRTLVASSALQQVKEVCTSTTKQENNNMCPVLYNHNFKYYYTRISYTCYITSQKNKIM